MDESIRRPFSTYYITGTANRGNGEKPSDSDASNACTLEWLRLINRSTLLIQLLV